MGHPILTLSTWSEFKAFIERQTDTIRKQRETKTLGHHSYPIYRGQADATWPLCTTLERLTHVDQGVHTYVDTLKSARRYLGNFVPDQLSAPVDEK
jgi:hypothetical protein